MKKVAAFQPNLLSAPGMSVKEARKRLGKKYESFSDAQIEHLVSLLSGIAREVVHNPGSKN